MTKALSNQFDFDFNEYKYLLEAVASMSRLYSTSEIPFVHYRFVEALYVRCSQAQDLTRSDKSFDALLKKNRGVGIKTFTSNRIDAVRKEKVAEFTRQASDGAFSDLDHYQTALKAADLRNTRILSDANEYAIDLDESIYHCLVRVTGGAIIHEEPYAVVETAQIKPTDTQGNEIPEFGEGAGHVYFTDGKSTYYFHTSKNTLFKFFDLAKFKNSEFMPLEIHDDIFERVISWRDFELDPPSIELPRKGADAKESPGGADFDHVVLPLYSYSKNNKEVKPKSGINQWNAGGRERKFGEAYIPIPKVIHHLHPGFFPKRDEKFRIKLPNGDLVKAKVCQQGSKALMSDPNIDLCDWLFRLIDLKGNESKKRFYEKRPYTYDDLKKVGKDSVKVVKVKNKDYEFELETTTIGSFEKFIGDNEDEEDQFAE